MNFVDGGECDGVPGTGDVAREEACVVSAAVLSSVIVLHFFADGSVMVCCGSGEVGCSQASECWERSEAKRLHVN